MDDEVQSADATAPTSTPGETLGRRDLLGTGAALAMFGGLAGGYGTFFALAGQFLFPSERKTAWWFVAATSQVLPGESIAFVSPTGVPVVIKRGAASAANGEHLGDDASLDDFVALSSTCPHLGCRVHWEGPQNRFFCPCHNGAFDAEGRPTAGPPLAADQHLPRYPLRIEHGMLFIEMPAETVGRAAQGLIT